jgi:DNA-binding FadR family transcriptional regulator
MATKEDTAVTGGGVGTEETGGDDLVRAAVFAPIGGEGLVQRTVRRIGEAIGLGVLVEGEKLPPEAEVAERLGISIMTLREALAILRESGYIETKRGRGGGTFVRTAPASPPAREGREVLAKLSPESLQDFTDLREAIGGHSAALAASRATVDDVAALETLVDQMEADERAALFRRLDSAFHLRIASATRSERLVATESRLQRELSPLLAAIPPSQSGLHRSNDEHRSILAAISKSDADGARLAMVAHIGGTSQVLIGLRHSSTRGKRVGKRTA